MTPFSFRALALAWTGLAGAAIVGAGALQASYVPPPVHVVSVPPPEAAAPPIPPVPFENRSLLAMLPPPRPAPPILLPVPPIPPPRVARAEPRHPARPTGMEPAYAAEPSYPGWVDTQQRYPGQYASGRGPYYPGQSYPYGWPPEY